VGDIPCSREFQTVRRARLWSIGRLKFIIVCKSRISDHNPEVDTFPEQPFELLLHGFLAQAIVRKSFAVFVNQERFLLRLHEANPQREHWVVRDPLSSELARGHVSDNRHKSLRLHSCRSRVKRRKAPYFKSRTGAMTMLTCRIGAYRRH
jgi:hypothetical protein